MTMPTIHLGINNCFAVKRWSEPEEWASVVREELSLEHYQFSLDLLPPAFGHGPAMEYVDRSRVAAEERGLRAHSVFTGLGAYSANLLLDADPSRRRSALDWYRSVVELAAQLGARGAGGHVGALSIASDADPAARASLLEAQREAMRELAAHAALRGLDHLLFENLAVAREYGTLLEESRALEASLEGSAVPWVLCLDLGHPASLTTGTSSDDPVRWLESEWASTPVIQLQQSSRGSDSHSAFTPETLATGGVQREPVLDAIAAWDTPEVYLFLEVIPAHEADDKAVLDGLKQSVEYWQKGIDALGA